MIIQVHVDVLSKRSGGMGQGMLCISGDLYMGNPSSFNGNSCRNLPEKVNNLRRISVRYDGSCPVFVDCFIVFNDVVKACFSKKLGGKLSPTKLTFSGKL